MLWGNRGAGFVGLESRPALPSASWAESHFKYDREICSGIGDRLGMYWAIAALAELAQITIFFPWCTRQRPYKLSELLERFTLSPRVVLVPELEWVSVTHQVQRFDSHIN
jgi:hypothetical protein